MKHFSSNISNFNCISLKCMPTSLWKQASPRCTHESIIVFSPLIPAVFCWKEGTLGNRRESYSWHIILAADSMTLTVDRTEVFGCVLWWKRFDNWHIVIMLACICSKVSFSKFCIFSKRGISTVILSSINLSRVSTKITSWIKHFSFIFVKHNRCNVVGIKMMGFS